ncbi:MAG: NAD(+)/NADH kinase [Deltaproteobacteria bacterium]|nr:NAD(+)/NADH kinase [Deltaproteobacteria bacterium]
MSDPRVVVIPKPLDALPAPAGPLGDDPETRAIATRLTLAREEHAASTATLRTLFAARWPDARWLETPSRAVLADADLVVTIGGDGTFLTVARHVDRTPILGINSSPSTSVGHYCGATARTVEAMLEAALSGALTPTPLTRIRAWIDGAELPYEALNDVLFAHRVPVASTRYALRVFADDPTDATHLAPRHELQLSSGIWVATAAGSTAAIRSAGGVVLPITDPRLQWRVREPFIRDGVVLDLKGGLTEQPIDIVSRSDRNALFLDGHPEPWTVPFGGRARLERSPRPLFAYLDALPRL